MKNRKLATIFAIVFIDLLGFSIILPLVPFYAEKFGANAIVTGFLVASYAAAQLVGAPLLGRMSDRFGRRPILLVSILGTIVGFIFLGVANSLWVLFASRIVDGLTGGNISVAQAYIADISDEKNRSRNFGLIGAAFGLGFIIGPAAGGLLSNVGQGIGVVNGIHWQFALPSFVAAVLATVNWVAAYFYLPESLSAERRAQLAARPRQEFTLQNLRAAFQRPLVGPLLHTRFFFSLAFSTFQTIFPLYALVRLGLDASQTAFILTYVGVLAVLVQGVLIGKITERFAEDKLIFWCMVIMTGGLAAWAVTPNVPVLLIVLAPLAFAGGVLSTVINSKLSKSVTPEEVGGTLGLSAALESATRAIAPSAGGILLGALGAWAPGIAAAAITAWLSSFVWRRVVRPAGMPESQNTMQDRQYETVNAD